MDERLIQQAITGTSDEGALLLTSLKDAMRLCFVPEVVLDNKYRLLDYRVERPIPPLAVDYLHLILRGVHENTLREWMIRVREAGYQPQLEVVRSMMLAFIDKQYQQAHWMHPFRLLIGQDGTRAAWTLLAEEGQDDPDVLQFANWLTYPPTELREDDWLWTTEASRQFTHKIMRAKDHMYAVNQINLHANHLALEEAVDALHRIMNRLKKRHAQTAWMRQRLAWTQGTIRFRQRMVRTIQTGQ